MFRTALRVPVALCVALLLVGFTVPSSSTQFAAAQTSDGLLVYHQINNMTEGAGSVGYPAFNHTNLPLALEPRIPPIR